jgi:hypothetical protein
VRELFVAEGLCELEEFQVNWVRFIRPAALNIVNVSGDECFGNP